MIKQNFNMYKSEKINYFKDCKILKNLYICH